MVPRASRRPRSLLLRPLTRPIVLCGPGPLICGRHSWGLAILSDSAQVFGRFRANRFHDCMPMPVRRPVNPQPADPRLRPCFLNGR